MATNTQSPDGNPTFQYFPPQGSVGIKFDKNNFMIQGGTRKLPNNANYYVYTHTSHEYPGGIEIVFSALQAPRLGDSVVNGVLVPRPIVPNNARDVFQNGMPQPIINNDPGTQLKRIQRRVPKTWPDDKVWIDEIDNLH